MPPFPQQRQPPSLLCLFPHSPFRSLVLLDELWEYAGSGGRFSLPERCCNFFSADLTFVVTRNKIPKSRNLWLRCIRHPGKQQCFRKRNKPEANISGLSMNPFPAPPPISNGESIEKQKNRDKISPDLIFFSPRITQRSHRVLPRYAKLM